VSVDQVTVLETGRLEVEAIVEEGPGRSSGGVVVGCGSLKWEGKEKESIDQRVLNLNKDSRWH